MAPGQGTFSIIPNAPCAFNGDLDTDRSIPGERPMTIKQVKKAYRKANADKGPKLSKAESRRQELFEQDRIRRELEKEKNQARARAARERKKEKEEKERAEKKKKGLPLVNVRPSQDTIARFLRGSVKKQDSRDSQVSQKNTVVNLPATTDNETDGGTLSSESEDDAEPPPKKQKIESPGPVSPTRKCSPSSAGVSDRTAPPTKHLDIGEEHKPADTDVTDLALMEFLDDELLDDSIDIAICSVEDTALRGQGSPPLEDQIIPNSQSPPKPPIPPKIHRSSPIPMQKLTPDQKGEDNVPLPPVRQPPHVLDANDANDANSKISQKSKRSTPDEPNPARSFRHPKTPMGPPPVPPKFKPRNQVTTNRGPSTSPFLPKQVQEPNSRLATHPPPKLNESPLQGIRKEQPPPNTQLAMLSHLVDLFPSPSQEVREIFDEPRLNTRTDHKRQRLKPNPPAHLERNPGFASARIAPNPDRKLPTTGDNKKRTFVQKNVPYDRPRTLGLPIVTNIQSSTTSTSSDIYDMSFFSTQDVSLSSQDIQDIEDDLLSLPKTKTIRDNSSNSNNTLAKPRPPLGQRQAGNSGLNPRSRSHGLPLEPQTRCASNEHPEKPPTARINAAPSRAEWNGRATNDQQSGSTAKLAKKPENPPSMTSFHQEKVSGATLIQRVTSPHNSPKPFFASGSRGMPYGYVIERAKTTAWEDAAARRKAQQELDHIQRLEDERLEKLLREEGGIETDMGVHASRTDSLNSGPILADTRSQSHVRPYTRPYTRPQDPPPPPRSINQLSNLVTSLGNQKIDEPNEEYRRKSRSRNSYEQMLQLLEDKENQKPEEKVIPASQETDYGDAGLDDVLYEMF